MTLVNWSPLRELDDLFNQYGRILGRSVTPSAADRQWKRGGMAPRRQYLRNRG